MGRSKDLRLVDCTTVCGDIYPQASFRECMYQRPVAWSVRIFCDVVLNALDSTSGSTWSEPLPNLHTELLPDESHAVDAKRTEWRRIVQEPGNDLHVCRVISGIDGVWRFAPI